MIYHDKNGKKYKGRLRKCKICGDEKLVRITVKGNICRKCAANMRDNSLIDKTFITINGKRRKAEIRICKKCGDKRIVRSDTSCKTGLCLKCRSSENGKKWGAINGPKTRKTGIGSYRKDALQIFRENVCAA